MTVIYILLGFGNSAYEMFDHIAIYEYSKEAYKTSYVTYERFIEGIVTATLPIISYTVFPENSNSIKITFLLAIIGYFALFIYVKFRKQYLGDNENKKQCVNGDGDFWHGFIDIICLNLIFETEILACDNNYKKYISI